MLKYFFLSAFCHHFALGFEGPEPNASRKNFDLSDKDKIVEFVKDGGTAVVHTKDAAQCTEAKLDIKEIAPPKSKDGCESVALPLCSEGLNDKAHTNVTVKEHNCRP